MAFATISSSLMAHGLSLSHYHDHGFLVLRGVFNHLEMAQLRDESDRILKEHHDLIHPRNLRCRFMPHHETGEQLFEVFDPVNDLSPICEQFSLDPRILRSLESIYDEPACLFKDKLIFKLPGATGYRLHQDIPLAWDSFPRSFITVLIPIDASSAQNGCTEVFRGYHGGFLSNDSGEYLLPDSAVKETRRVTLELEPGDVAIFHGLTPHRSGPNRSTGMRRALYLSYNATSDGGDQRTAHYAQFQTRMSQRLRQASDEPVFFR